MEIKATSMRVGSVGAGSDSTEWTLVVIPDTQRLAANNPTAYNSLYQWIVDNAVAEDIRMVMHVGDYVNLGSSDTEWARADTAVNRLHSNSIPFIHNAGNHDYDDDGQGTYSRKTTKWQTAFPESDWSGYPWYLESYENITTNMAAKMTIGSTSYLFISVEFWARAGAIAWADSVITANPTDHIIMTTHAMTAPDSSFETDVRQTTGGQGGVPVYYGICNYSADADCKTGQEIFDDFVSSHSNIILVANGHDVLNNAGEVVGQGVAGKTAFSKRTDIIGGRTINTHMFNYQNDSGNGYEDSAYLRLYRISNTGTFSVETYNPVRDTNLSDTENQFSGSFN